MIGVHSGVARHYLREGLGVDTCHLCGRHLYLPDNLKEPRDSFLALALTLLLLLTPSSCHRGKYGLRLRCFGGASVFLSGIPLCISLPAPESLVLTVTRNSVLLGYFGSFLP